MIFRALSTVAVAALAVYLGSGKLSLGQSTTSAHRDETRRGVGATAYYVSWLRSLELDRTDRPPVARDDVAGALFAPLGPAPIAWRAARLAWRAVDRFWPTSLVAPPRIWRDEKMVSDVIAVRTSFIDKHLTKAAPQCVIVGAGLDARSVRFRNHSWLVLLRNLSCFELDFEGVLSAKRELFAAAGFPIPSDAKLVATDLSEGAERWSADLVSAGFDPSTRTTWVLEGLTSYLSQDELDALLAGITKLSAHLSDVIATWIRPAKNADTEQPIVMKSGLHRTFFEDPTAVLARAGAWRLIVQESIEAAAARVRVAVPTSPVGGGYWLTVHGMQPASVAASGHYGDVLTRSQTLD